MIPFNSIIQGERLCQNIGLSYTLQCNARCAHCAVSAGPEVRGTLGVDRSISLIRTAAERGVSVVGITGGEPLLFEHDLLTIMELCHRDYETVFSLTTNANWASTPANATATVRRLVAHGLKSLRISADVYHQKWIPLERVVFATEAALGAGAPVMVSAVVGRREPETASILNRLRRLPVHVGVQPLLRQGRAAHEIPADHVPNITTHQSRFAACIQAGQVFVTHTGQVFLCCNSNMDESSIKQSGLWLGDVNSESFGDILERNERSLLCRILAAYGPHEVRRILEKYDPECCLGLTSQYSGMCAYCQDLLSNPSRMPRVQRALELYAMDRNLGVQGLVHQGADQINRTEVTAT